MIKTIKVFCANEQIETEHSIDINDVGEIILTCISEIGTEEAPQQCGRFLKFPKGTNAETLRSEIVNHKTVNDGQISVESIEEEKTKLLDELFPEEA